MSTSQQDAFCVDPAELRTQFGTTIPMVAIRDAMVWPDFGGAWASSAVALSLLLMAVRDVVLWRIDAALWVTLGLLLLTVVFRLGNRPKYDVMAVTWDRLAVPVYATEDLAAAAAVCSQINRVASLSIEARNS